MRSALLVLILVIIVFVAAVATGFLNISQTREAKAPEISATQNGVAAKGGQAPAFDVETGSVKVGRKETSVKVPTLEMRKAGHNEATGTTNNAM